MKLEGGRKRIESVEAILDAEIPVMGHIGLTPQSIHALGGFKVQGKQLDAARKLVDDAVALADAGCFALVLEAVPDGVARMVTETVSIPTIGIGAGRHCDGQVLVWHDLLGFTGEGRKLPKFVRAYASLEMDATDAVTAVRRRRARGPLPVERRDVPHDRPDGRRARPLRRHHPRARAHAITLRRSRADAVELRPVGPVASVSCRTGLRDRGRDRHRRRVPGRRSSAVIMRSSVGGQSKAEAGTGVAEALDGRDARPARAVRGARPKRSSRWATGA